MFAFVLAFLAVAFGAWVQATVGFGYALLSAPLVALVAPALVPGAIMVSSVVLSLTTALSERGSIDAKGISLALLGRIPGIVVAALLAKRLGGAYFDALFGGLVLSAVALSLSGVRLPLTTASLCGAGFVSGLMGTLTSIGGPPMALVYQHAEAPRLRASLNAYFAAGSCLSITGLYFVGQFGARQLWDGLLLLPGCGVGMLLSLRTRGFLTEGRTRQGVLAVASAAALAVVLKSLWMSAR